MVCDAGPVALIERRDQVKGMSKKAGGLRLIARFSRGRVEIFRMLDESGKGVLMLPRLTGVISGIQGK